MKLRLTLIISGLLIFAWVVVGALLDSASKIRSIDRARISQSSRQSTRAPSSTGATSNAPGPKNKNLWRDFQTQYGIDLNPQFVRKSADRSVLVAIHGRAGHGKQSASKFDPSDPQVAVQRAKEILEAARDLLGLDPELSIDDNPVAKGSATSVQVYFQETKGGIPVLPSGQITIDLGSDGELLGLYSSYVHSISLKNQTLLPANGGRQIIWVPRGGGGNSNPGYFAYEHFQQGRQVIIDAQTGEVLYQRDKRQF